MEQNPWLPNSHSSGQTTFTPRDKPEVTLPCSHEGATGSNMSYYWSMITT
jgi:hypothetical protein